jgi:tetratricopeptide (TPR) repeat protein
MTQGSLPAGVMQLDELEILVVVDNETDTLSSVDDGVPQIPEIVHLAARTPPSREYEGHECKTVFDQLCCACHGLSVLITGRRNGNEHTMLFDVGPYPDLWLDNARRLDEATSSFEEAVRLSPHDPYRWGFLMYGSLAHLFAKRHELAAEWAEKAVRVPNSHYWANAALVAALGHLNRPDEARSAVAGLQRRRPGFSCSFAKDHLFYVKDSAQVEHYIEGLRKAGLPE